MADILTTIVNTISGLFTGIANGLTTVIDQAGTLSSNIIN